MFTEPKIEECPAVAYLGKRGTVSIGGLSSAIPSYLDEGMKWLSEKGVAPTDAPIIRFHTCPENPTPDALMDVSIGWPIPSPMAANGGFVCDSLPPGKYASLVYTGAENGIPGNAALIAWARNNDLRWDCWEVKGGEGFAGRVEYLLDGPEDDPDPANWKTRVAIKVKEE